MNYQEEREWLANVKAGDKVFVTSRWGAGEIETVERTTKTLIILSRGQKYRRSDGYQPGSDRYYAGSIRPVTDDRLEAIALHKFSYKVREALEEITTHIRVNKPRPDKQARNQVLELLGEIKSLLGVESKE